MLKVEIIVLNYNGGNLFLECLPSFMAAVRRTKYPTKLVIVENGSTDGSDRLAQELYPEITVWRANENRVLCSYNDYLAVSDCDIAVLMNNDIKVNEDFLDPLIEYFERDADVFMVTPRCLSFDGLHHEGGITRFRIKYGIFWASSRYAGYEKDVHQRHRTMAAGYGAFDRKKFLELGGYDPLYLPGRLEDSDLCFRAWKKGWVLYYEPASLIYHKGGASFHKEYGESGTLRINHRNSFLFVWKNIRDARYLMAHLFFLPWRLGIAILRGHFEFILGFKDALSLLPAALKRRAQAAPS
ncbi:MAG: glycosyltransferase, partial [Candidatus Omnitrophica bacterium]|nr:glycosyltransferase [Candidatus Omnitrophota bacterium]